MWINIFTVDCHFCISTDMAWHKTRIYHTNLDRSSFLDITNKSQLFNRTFSFSPLKKKKKCPINVNENIISTKPVEHNYPTSEYAVYVSPIRIGSSLETRKIVLVSFECHHPRKENAKFFVLLICLESHENNRKKFTKPRRASTFNGIVSLLKI